MAHFDDVLTETEETKPAPTLEKKLREITPEPTLTLVESLQTPKSRLQQLKEQLSKLPS